MFVLANTGSRLNLVNMYYHQSVAERHPKSVLKFAYLEDMGDVDTFNISGLYRGKESEQWKWGVDLPVVITYKTSFVVNGKSVTVSLVLGERVACNTTFLWAFLQKIKASIMTNYNALVSGLMDDQFKTEMMVPQISKESPKTSEVIPVSLPVAIL